ncbi:MAG: 5-bromo-4-chloroindolyl phosphate hydrolysis family protein [Lachnospiraceae bacterium]|nr:5-bromo-4-chloroindolyl phosphate hydrolysis family protein [Lachnospiraceae bacterium]
MSIKLGGIADAGDEILSAVSKAVDSGDYSTLGTEISQSIGAATEDIARQVAGNKINREQEQREAQTARDMAARSQNEHSLNYYQTKNIIKSPKQMLSTPFLQGKSRSKTGVGAYIGGLTGTIVGGVGTFFTGIAGIIGMAASPEIGIAGFVVTGVFGVTTAVFAAIMHSGKKKKELFKKYLEYGRIIGPVEFITIENLAAKLNQSEAEVKNDLYEFKNNGFLPKARMDEAETTLMLTDSSFEQYRQAEENRRLREAEEKKWNTVGAGANEYQINAANSLIDEGQKYISHIRDLNNQISDEDMTSKLYRLESILKRIFDKVRQQPKSATDLRKFMDYYLPTTDKLVSAYVDLCKQPEGLDNVDKTKNDIKDALDQINDGFEKLLNSLFEDLALDISSDISVMNTMMKQDGLVEDENAPKPDANANGFDFDINYKPTLKL